MNEIQVVCWRCEEEYNEDKIIHDKSGYFFCYKCVEQLNEIREKNILDKWLDDV